MSTVRHYLALAGTAVLVLVWIVFLIVVGFIGLSKGTGVLFLLFLGLIYSWMLSAYLHYRHGRQDEMLQVLATVVESRAPLAPALWAYLDDRPRGVWRETWVFLFLLFVVPGFYWFRHQRNNYDAKVARVAARLEKGYELSEALEAVPAVVPQDTVLAVFLGEATGNLVPCLRNAAQVRLTAVWVELIPRIIYPILVTLFTVAVLSFWGIYIGPRVESICRDMKTDLPEITRNLLWNSDLLASCLWLALASLLGVFAFLLPTLVSSHFRYYCPGVGRFYQMHVQYRVLHMLSLLIEAKQPIPKALNMLVDAEFGSVLIRQKLSKVAAHVQRGEALAPTLRHAGLLPGSMVPLVQSAERVGNLAWVLRELAELRGTRLVRLMRQVSTLIWPVVVGGLGALIGYVTLAMFLPLVNLLEELTK